VYYRRSDRLNRRKHTAFGLSMHALQSAYTGMLVSLRMDAELVLGILTEIQPLHRR